MTKEDFLKRLTALYAACNRADSDGRKADESWMTSDLAGTNGCALFDSVMQAAAFTNEDREAFYAAL